MPVAPGARHAPAASSRAHEAISGGRYSEDAPDLVEAFMDHVDVNFLFAAALSCKAFGAARAALAARDREKAARPSAPKEPSTAYSFYLEAAHSRPPRAF